MSQGIKVSKPGFDIKTTDVKNQIFNSDNNSLKILAQGSVSISVSTVVGHVYSTTIAHGLSFTPSHMTFYQHRDSTKSYPPSGNNADSLDGVGSATSDGTNLTIGITGNGTAYTATVYYYIFADPGA